ncbi:MAG: hypothetical protein IPI27_20405 [Betaproteobacteria bacterium]|nr:hypothetical protein [Betaproteobacteria bacterium]
MNGSRESEIWLLARLLAQRSDCAGRKEHLRLLSRQQAPVHGQLVPHLLGKSGKIGLRVERPPEVRIITPVISELEEALQVNAAIGQVPNLAVDFASCPIQLQPCVPCPAQTGCHVGTVVHLTQGLDSVEEIEVSLSARDELLRGHFGERPLVNMVELQPFAKRDVLGNTNIG